MSSDHRLAFVTGTEYTGDLASAGGVPKGLDGADVLCNRAAASANVSGMFIAWISDSTTSAIARISGAGPWYDTNDQLLFTNSTNLATVPATSFSSTESGATLPALKYSWTGTDTGGQSHASGGSFCRDWTNSTENNVISGQIDNTAKWTNGFQDSCNARNHLYCFQL